MVAQIKIRDATNTLRTITGIKMRDDTGILRTITRVRMRDDGNILRTVFGALTVSATSPSNGTGTTSTITSTPVSAVTVTGGVAPYTYLWRAYLNNPVTYNPDGITITSPTGSSTAFKKTGMIAEEQFSGSFECVVTDTLGATATTNIVSSLLIRTA